MRKCAVIDIGSNTIRLSVYRVEEGNVQNLLSRKIMAGLASYVKKGKMTKDGVHTACSSLNSYKELLRNLDISEYYAFATASLRNIANTDDVLREIQLKTGIKVDVLSGEDEGKLSLRGAISSINVEDGLLIDLGGGSTEIVPFKDSKASVVYSLRAGSLTLFKKFVEEFLPTRKECQNIAEYYEGLLDAGDIFIPESRVICGVGGTFRAITKLVDSISGRPEGSNQFTRKEMDDLYDFLKERDKKSRDLLLKATPDRLHTVMPGMAAVKVLMEKANCQNVKVSQTGVREGYLYSKVLNI